MKKSNKSIFDGRTMGPLDLRVLVQGYPLRSQVRKFFKDVIEKHLGKAGLGDLDCQVKGLVFDDFTLIHHPIIDGGGFEVKMEIRVNLVAPRGDLSAKKKPTKKLRSID